MRLFIVIAVVCFALAVICIAASTVVVVGKVDWAICGALAFVLDAATGYVLPTRRE